MEDRTENFFQKMINKLSVLNSESTSRHSFLEDVCTFFDLSHAFIYESDHRGVFWKKEYCELAKNRTFDDSLNLKELLGLELLSELCSKKVIVCTGDTEKTMLEKKLTEIFGVSTIVFIPILNQHFEIASFIGLADRRNRPRHANSTIDNASALLTLLASELRLEMFQKGIKNTEAALSNVLDHIGIDIYVNDYYTHDILYVNKSMAAPYGGVQNMIGKKCWASIFTDKTEACDFCPQPKLLDENQEPNKTYTWDYERPFDKSWFRVLSSSFTWTDGRIAHIVASVDITESKKNEMLIEKLAQFDHLTGLANRRSLNDDIQLFIADNTKFGSHWYLFFCDLDGFKTVNDTLGHHAGDVLLKGIANDLSDLCSNEIRAYRQGGDEFVLLVKDNHSEEFIRKLIEQLFLLFKKRYEYDGKDMGCGCSIGIAHYPDDATTLKEILHLADTAMYRVKKDGRGTARFSYKGKYLNIDDYFKMK